MRERYPCSWLTNVPELFERRAPGNTCLSAIASFRGGRRGAIDEPINDSKGCGGIMRVAPIGLYFDGERHTSDEVARLSTEAAALTHGHELGYIPAAALVHIVHTVSHSEDPLDVRELNIVFIGPYDLSNSLGLIGQVSCPLR